MSRIVLFFSLFLCSITAFAANVLISPVILKLGSNQQILSFTVTNKSDAKVTFQLSAKKWSQKNGVDSTANTNDIIVTPPIVTIAPGTEQTVRVGLRSPTNHQTEATYRIILSQLPIDLKKHIDNSLNMIFTFSLPLFIAPAQEYKNIVWNIKKLAASKLQVKLLNKSNVHVVITKLALQDPKGQIYFSSKITGRVLSGQSQEWTLSLKKPLTNNRITVHAITDWQDKYYRELNAEVPVN
jgi:fimbrial chaperone protein